ncbi:MAG TPA: hypothetical protein VJ868_01975 [Actinomycetota bacterium]|nr:hypothetical protein [Actinomycetota bacterium]
MREDSEAPWCITKVSETVPLAAGTLGTDPWTLYGYRAVFDGFRYVGPPDALAPERVRHPSVCLDWEGLERDMGFCETGAGLGFDAPRMLLQAPPAKRAAPPEVMRWEVALKDGYGPSVGHETSRGYLIVKWTLPSTERITVDFDGKSMEVRVIGPFPKLRTDWKLAIVDLPRRGPAVFRAYDADGDLIWEQHIRAERLD